jgi:hypothetical protein
MASEEHLAILKQGVEAWNKWAEANPKEAPDFSETDLSWNETRFLRKANLSAANFTKTDLNTINLSDAGGAPHLPGRTSRGRCSRART